MTRTFASALIFAMLLPFLGRADGAMLTYSLTNIGGNSWQYDYSFSSAQALPANTGFSVYFEAGVAAGLTEVAAPAGWDTLIVQPGSFLGDSEGYYDALALNGLAAGETAGLFSLRLNWLAVNSQPGDPRFEVYRLGSTFEVIESGLASLVPVPAAGLLFGSGLAGLLLLVRRRV